MVFFVQTFTRSGDTNSKKREKLLSTWRLLQRHSVQLELRLSIQSVNGARSHASFLWCLFNVQCNVFFDLRMKPEFLSVGISRTGPWALSCFSPGAAGLWAEACSSSTAGGAGLVLAVVEAGLLLCVMGYCLLSLLSKRPLQTLRVQSLLFYCPHVCVHVLMTCFCFIAVMKFGQVPGRDSAPGHQDDLVCLFSSQTKWTSLNIVITIVQSQSCVLTGQTGGSLLTTQAGKVLAHKNKQPSLYYLLAWKRPYWQSSYWE